MRKIGIWALALALAVVAGLFAGYVASAGARPSAEEPNAKVFHVNVDGRQIPCIMVDPPKPSLAVSCDWGQR